jgi:large subunit ribosomal protein L28
MRMSRDRQGARVRSRTQELLMSKVCSLCGRHPSFGNNRSHSMVATRRRFDPNLQKMRILVDGVAKRAYVCTRCLKAGKVSKAL